MVAYSPFGHGQFPSPHTRGGRVLAEIAAAHGATARQVALRFLVRQPSLLTISQVRPAPGTPRRTQGAGDLQLTEAELTRIDEGVSARLPVPRERSRCCRSVSQNSPLTKGELEGFPRRAARP